MRVRHFLTLATGLLECLCFCGVLFGWSSLVFILKAESFFSLHCVNATGDSVAKFQDGGCSEQDEKLSLVFTVGSAAVNLLSLPSGFLFDRFGTAAARLCAIFCYTTGALMFAFANKALSFLLFPALPLMAVGANIFLISNIQVGNLFGSRRSTIITLHNGAFDSSAAIFLFIKLIYESGISLHASFFFLSACSVIHLLRTLFLMPRKFIPYPLPDDYTYGIACTKAKATTASTENITEELEETPTDRDSSVKEKTFRECVLSRFFLCHLLWLSVIQLRHFFFIGTLNIMLQRLSSGDPSLVSQYTNAFAITQLCGVFCAPWNGLILDRHKSKALAEGESEQEADLRASVISLTVTALQCLLFSVCATIPVLKLQYFTFVLQVLNRSFLYGGNATFVCVAFPMRHFGKVLGLVTALSALFSLLQYLCLTLVQDVLNGDPLYVNIGLTVLSLAAFIHPVSVYLYRRRRAQERASS